MTEIATETLKREWSGALRKWWFVPLLAASGAGAIAYGVAKPFDPVYFSAITYVYTPLRDPGEFQDFIDALPADVERLPDSHGNQHLILAAPTFSEARDRLVAVQTALHDIVEAGLAQPEATATAEQSAWLDKFRSQSVSVSQQGGGGEITCLAIAWAFMLALAGILFARSRKFDLETKSFASTAHV